jgi:hypothetical protein
MDGKQDPDHPTNECRGNLTRLKLPNSEQIVVDSGYILIRNVGKRDRDEWIAESPSI